MGYFTISTANIYTGEFDQKFSIKSNAQEFAGQGERGGGGGHRQLNIDIEWYMLFYLQWLQKLQVDNNIKYIEVDADFLNII